MLKGLHILLNSYGLAMFIASLFTIIMKEIYLCHSGLGDVVKEGAKDPKRQNTGKSSVKQSLLETTAYMRMMPLNQ